MDNNLIDELREMFRDGATPSKLIRHLVDRLGQTQNLHFMIRDYFSEAFGVQLIRNVIAKEDYSPNLQDAHFNRNVVPELIQNISEWNTANLEDTWLSGLIVRSLNEHKDSLQGIRFDELSRVWPDMNEKERQYIIQKNAIINHDWEVIKCLAALAERLQQQVIDLEKRSKSEQNGNAAS